MRTIFLDNTPMRDLCKDPNGELWNSFLDLTKEIGIPIENRRVDVYSDWRTFLEFVGAGNVLRKLPQDDSREMAEALKHVLSSDSVDQVDDTNNFIDALWKQSISQVQKFPLLYPSALLDQYHRQILYCETKGAQELLPIVADKYARRLEDYPDKSHLEISRLLGWHHMHARLNQFLSTKSPKDRNPDKLWQVYEQLLNSFYWVVKDHSIQLPFLPVVNSAYQHAVKFEGSTSDETIPRWTRDISKHRLKHGEDLVDCAYIDAAILGVINTENGDLIQKPVTVFTIDKPDQVLCRLQMCRQMLEKLAVGVDGWDIPPLYSCEVVCLERVGAKYILIDKITHSIPLPTN